MSERTSLADPLRALIEGERLDQPTFHTRYESMPPDSWAELIGGVVHQPRRPDHAHGRIHVPAIVWLSYYAEATPEVEVLANASIILGWKSEPQPDAVLRILPECGGRTRTLGGYVHGAPELIVEVSRGTRYVDLGPKLIDYEQAGVLEYIVRAADPDEILWFQQEQGSLALIPPDADGLYRSRAFPGLWLDPEALLQADTRRMRTVLDMGSSINEHSEFIARLEVARASY